MLFNRFAEEIQKNGLFREGDTVVAAVSGGADSICLLHLLHRLRDIRKFSILCAHVNHGIREEAGEDAAFVASCCQAWNIPFVIHNADIPLKAKEEGISLELAGRMERYSFFASLKADAILTAHNKNDAVESMLLHLIRGCGLEGLCGIPQKRDDGICRPLLLFSRAEIEKYLLEHKLEWREDETNRDTLYTRNKIRQELIPKIEEMNPSFLETATRMIEVLKSENAFLQESVKTEGIVFKEKNCTLFSIKALEDIPEVLQRRVVYTEFTCYTDIMQILSLLKASNGTRIHLSGGWTAEREYDHISVYKDEAVALKAIPLPDAGRILFGQYVIMVGEGNMKLTKKKYWIRTRKEGDFFYPEGMSGKKKLKDFFIDLKIPKRLRDQIPILVFGDEIAAVGNMRRSRKFVPHSEPYISVSIEPIENV